MAKSTRKGRSALSIENQEARMIALATDLAEQQLRDGTASSQVISHYLKLGSVKAQLELEKERAEIKLLQAKTKSVESSEEYKVLVEDAIKAMRNYKGNGDPDEYEYDW